MATLPVAEQPVAEFERLSLSALLEFYGAKFRTELALQFAYRGALAIWLLSLVSQPLISLVVWTTVAETNGGSAGGFTAGEYAAYFVILMVVNQLTFSWHMWEFEWRVRTGFFSPVLLRPLHPVHNDIIENLTFKALTLVALLPIAVTLGFAFDARFAPSLADVVAFGPALVLAMALRFLVEWTVALAAFWMTRTMAVNQVFGVLSFFLSGLIAPLALFPAPVQVAAAILPFRWSVAFPVELAQGQLSGVEILLGLLAQVIWIVLAVVLLRLVWRHGVRRYSAVGA
ncbi:MAG: ABC-2 family transporter protein [Chloroflexia bacterium]|nr:ABC-2 family transporter protein [Chloroflexia bacterium]